MRRDEDHLVKAIVIVNESEITNVPCKIFLPERIQEKPYVIFKPSEEDQNRIMASHKGSLHASVYGFDKEKELTIEAPEVYFSESSTKNWGDGMSDRTITGEPQDLHIIRHIRQNDNTQNTKIVFWISPNRFLTPDIRKSSSYTGDLKYERMTNLEFVIKNKINLLFDLHFHSKKAENGDFVQWSFLVACAELEIQADDVNTLRKDILPNIDDFLLIASFAARERTVCLGWAAIDKNSHATFYRGNYVFPQTNGDGSLNIGLINMSNFKKFIRICYPAFLRYENKIALRNALHSVVPSKAYTVEASFLKMFAGLEALLLDFRRCEDLELVLKKAEWSCLRKYLQKCIKKSSNPKLRRPQRTLLYSKLDELNRIPLREAFDQFCNRYSIDLSDLWPFFSKNQLVGLVDIRNKLIHGDPFSHDVFEALIVAKEHLLYTLERVLSRILQWDVASPCYLNTHMKVIKEMPYAQEILSDYISGPASSRLD